MKANSLKAVACGLLVASTAPAEASTAYYLRFADINGGVETKDYKGAIALESFTWSIEILPPANPREKPIMEGTEFTWIQALDIAVPKLLATLGDRIASAEMHAVFVNDAKPFEFFTMKFSDVFITSLDINASSDEPPSVEGAFSYELLELIVTPQKPDGTAGTAVSGKFSPSGFSGSTAVFAQLADFSSPLIETSAVPLPASLPFLLSGLAGLGWAGGRKARERKLESIE